MNSAFKRSVIFVLVSLMTSACASTRHTPKMVGSAHFQAESHAVWNRPLEVGFDMKEQSVQGSATDTEILPIFSYFVRLFGGEDALTKAAIFNAIQQTNADGLYVTATSTKESGFWPFYYTKTVYVIGKVLTIKKMGTVSKARADRSRMPYIVTKDVDQE